MNDKKFCLINEPWLRVLTLDGVISEVSLMELFSSAHSYKCLAGEIPMQNVAILRFLEAIVYTVISRYESDGRLRTEVSADHLLDAYEELWNKGSFYSEPFCKYFDLWSERFWLVHPDTPFYQVAHKPGEKIGTQCSAAKLNGELFESSNQTQLFSGRRGEKKSELLFSEAARWLLFMNSFDDCAAKNPSPKECWTSKLGITIPKGRNLFETLMLNCQVVNEYLECWPDNRPSWEEDIPNSLSDIKLRQIPRPAGPAALMSVISRRIALDISDRNTVTGYQLTAGDYFDGTDYFLEPMTVWRHVEAKKNEPERWIPKKFEPTRFIWQEFPTMIDIENDRCSPGVVRWINLLEGQDVNIISKEYPLTFETCSVFYGSMSCKIAKDYHDEIKFLGALIDNKNIKWKMLVREMVDITEKVAKEIEILEYRINIASTGVQNEGSETNAKELLLQRADSAFREWLLTVGDDNSNSISVARKQWRNVLNNIAVECANDMVMAAGLPAFTGRFIKKDERSSIHYSAPEAYIRFTRSLKKILEEGGNN